MFVSDTLRVSSLMLYIFVCYWLIATVQVMTEFFVACITAHYFFRERQGSDEVWRFLRTAGAASFGSMCAIGALKATSAFVSFVMRLLKRAEKSFLGGLASSFIVPLIRFCQAFLELFSSEAIVQIAVHGCSLSEAGRKVTEQASLKSLLSLGILVHAIVFLCNAVGVAIASYVVLPRVMQREELKGSESFTVLLLIIAFCYFVANKYSSLVARMYATLLSSSTARTRTSIYFAYRAHAHRFREFLFPVSS